MDRIAAFSDANSVPFKQLTAYLTARRALKEEERRGSAEGFKLVLDSRVAGEEVLRLSKVFGCEVEVSDRAAVPGSYAQAYHAAAREFLRQTKRWPGEELLEFDGDLASLALRRKQDTHVCLTRRGAEAEAFATAEIARLEAVGRRKDVKGYATDAMAMVRALRGRDTDWRVCGEASSCRVRVETILVDLTRNDLSAEQTLCAIEQHGASRAKVMMYFEPAMLVDSEGTITSGGRWLVDREQDAVFLIFTTMAHRPVTYSYSGMLSYLMSASVTSGSLEGCMEVFDSRGGLCYVEVLLAGGAARSDCQVVATHHDGPAAGLAVLEQEWVPPGSLGRQRVRTVVSMPLVEKLIEKVSSLEDKALALPTVRKMVGSETNLQVGRMTMFTKALVVQTHVPELLALGVLKVVVARRAEARRVSGLLASSEAQGLGSRAWEAMAEGMASFAKALALGTLAGVASGAVAADYSATVRPLTSVYDVVSVARRGRVVSGYPGGGVARSSSADDAVLAAARRAAALERAESQDESVTYLEVKEEQVRRQVPPAQGRRAELVEAMCEAFDAGSVPPPPREVSRCAEAVEPVCTVEEPVAGAAQAVTDGFRECFGPLGEVDYSSKGYQVSAADREMAMDVAYCAVDTSIDKIAPARVVRGSHVKAHGEAGRPRIQTEALLSFGGRVANAPVLADLANWDTLFSEVFQRYQRVCFKPGWETVVAKRVEGGLWQPRRAELERYASRMDASKVEAALREDFAVGNLDMQRWSAILKPEAKPKTALAGADTYKGTQSISYQPEKMANALFSSMLIEACDVIEEVTRENVRVNIRQSDADFERWFNSLNPARESAGSRRVQVEADITQCDKSHSVRNLMFYLYFLERLGLYQGWRELWEAVLGTKRLSSAMMGLFIHVVAELLSGAWWTLALNSVVTSAALVQGLELEPEDVLSLAAQGDDSLVEVLRSVSAEGGAEYMRNAFNFEVKILIIPPQSAMYFCSKFLVGYDGYWFYVRDPAKAAAAWSRPVALAADLKELWVSFRDSCRHYEKMEVMDRLDVAFVERYRADGSARGMLRGLTSAVMSFEEFEAGYAGEVVLCA